MRPNPDQHADDGERGQGECPPKAHAIENADGDERDGADDVIALVGELPLELEVELLLVRLDVNIRRAAFDGIYVYASEVRNCFRSLHTHAPCA